MALKETPPPELGAPCPDFRLPHVADGRWCARDDYAAADVLLVMFICNHCPYVQAIEDRLVRLGEELRGKSAQVVAICSNDAVTYPDDAPAKLAERWREKGYGFPYLHDESQEVARAFGAVCTPDFFLYDKDRRLAYRGRLDDAWKDESKVTTRELALAIEALLSGGRPSPLQKPSMGCSIKWRVEA